MNDNFDDFKTTIQNFSNWLDSIPPYEYSLYGTILAYIIAPLLTTNAQNSLGNWFEQVGQILLTISAQASASPTDDEYNSLLKEVEKLKQEINYLKNNS